MTFAAFASGLITITGVLTLIAISLALIAWAYQHAVEWYLHYLDNDPYHAKERAAKELGEQLIADHYWIDQKEGSELMLELGETLKEQGVYTVSSLRDRYWERIGYKRGQR